MSLDELLDRMKNVEKYYDKQGKPISMLEWAKLLSDFEYKRLKVDQIGDFHISTVWLGMDHNFINHCLRDAEPHIFETMIFKGKEGDLNWEPLFCDRYPTKNQALVGHLKAVKKVNEGEFI